MIGMNDKELQNRYKQAEQLALAIKDLDYAMELNEVIVHNSVTNGCYVGCTVEIAVGFLYNTALECIEFEGGYEPCDDFRGWHAQYNNVYSFKW